MHGFKDCETCMAYSGLRCPTDYEPIEGGYRLFKRCCMSTRRETPKDGKCYFMTFPKRETKI